MKLGSMVFLSVSLISITAETAPALHRRCTEWT